jgi:hypothetical protein
MSFLFLYNSGNEIRKNGLHVYQNFFFSIKLAEYMLEEKTVPGIIFAMFFNRIKQVKLKKLAFAF